MVVPQDAFALCVDGFESVATEDAGQQVQQRLMTETTGLKEVSTKHPHRCCALSIY